MDLIEYTSKDNKSKDNEMMDFEKANIHFDEFKKYLNSVDIQTIQTDLDLMVFFEKFIERNKKSTFKEFFEYLLNNRYKGEVHLKSDNDYIRKFEFRKLTLDDYAFIESIKDKEYVISSYFEYCTCPPIPCYVLRFKDEIEKETPTTVILHELKY